MRIAVLLSAGRHPVSGRPALARVEAQAAAMALALGGEVAGFHAGPDADAARQALGHGLPRLVHLRDPAGSDPVPSLALALAEFAPDLVLCGPRTVGGDETGLVPYRLAEATGRPIVADVCALRRDGTDWALEQALPRGARRLLREQGSPVATLNAAAPPPLAYVFARERSGLVEVREGVGAPGEASALVERPLRRRARLRPGAVEGGSAAERLRAATEAAGPAKGELLVDPAPQDAARAILAHLRRIKALPERPV